MVTKEELINLYNSGKTTREIASHINETYTKTRTLLLNAGVVFRNRWENNKGMYKKGREAENKITLTQEQDNTLINLFNNYVPIREISVKLGNVSTKAIYRRIKELGLTRDNGRMMSRIKRDKSLDQDIITYYQNGNTMSATSEKFNTSRETIKRILSENNVKQRTLSEVQCISHGKDYPETLENYEDLFDMYITRGMTKKEIGLQLNVDPGTVDRALREFGIPVRGVKETVNVRVRFGPESSNWKGGRTGIYLRIRGLFSNHLVKETLDRDNHTCQLCGSHEHLEVHHIRPFKEIFNEVLKENGITSDNLSENEENLFMKIKDDPRFLDPNNLITYCRDCHLFNVHGYKRDRTLSSTNEEDKINKEENND